MKPEDTIKGRCHTNIDNVDCYITEFARIPNIGESVMIFYKARESMMKVVGITHDFRNGEPFIHVELWEQSFMQR